MELTSDLIAIQGLFKGFEQNVGTLANIRYKGGNEEKIQQITNNLKQFFTIKNYIYEESSLPNAAYKNELKDIVTFLILNTDFNNPIEIQEYSHLINIMPKLSKCLLVNIIANLDIPNFYEYSCTILTLNQNNELLHEAVLCLKNSKPETNLSHTFIILNEAIKTLSDINTGSLAVRESVDTLNDICSQLLLNVSGFDPDIVKTWRKLHLYKHMGFTLLNLFKLLLVCQPETSTLAKIMDHLLRTTFVIVRAITINVFCAWAEIEYEGEILQLYVAEQAFHIVEKYSKFKPAKELVQVLGTMAKKPKTLTEIIQLASVDKIIEKVNVQDENQRQWFTALLNTQLFQTKASIDCLEKWWNLCQYDDVVKIVMLARDHKNPEINKIVNKCAGNLSVKDLSIVMGRYFRECGINNDLQFSESIQSELTLSLNQINHSKERNLSLHELESSSIKKIQLLLLQNPEEVVSILYTECLKNVVYTYWLKHCFLVIENVLQIESLGFKTLQKIYKQHPNLENETGYIHLNEMLLETICITEENLYSQILQPLIEQAYNNEKYEDIKCLFLILKELKLNIHDCLKNNLLKFLMDTLQNCRCKYETFSNLKLEISIASIDLIKKLGNFNKELKMEEDYSPLNKFYLNSNNLSYLGYIFPEFSIDNYGEVVAKLIKVLPRCVPNEWIMITNDLNSRCGSYKSLEFLTHCLMLICEVTKTQNQIVFSSLKYYLQSYGMSLKHLKSLANAMIFEVDLIKKVCTLLRWIPNDLRYSEGVNLITLFSDEALRSLADDKPFVCTLVAMENAPLAQIIVTKMLAN